MARLERKHSLPTRLFHWINVPILAVMIWSGMLIYWANDVYAIRLGGFTLIKFFPGWFYRYFHIDHRLAEGMAWHFTFMWFFATNGLLYVAYTAVERRVAPPVAEPPYVRRGVASRPARPWTAEGAFAASQIQRSAAAGLYGSRRDGGRVALDRPGDL